MANSAVTAAQSTFRNKGNQSRWESFRRTNPGSKLSASEWWKRTGRSQRDALRRRRRPEVAVTGPVVKGSPKAAILGNLRRKADIIAGLAQRT